MFIFFGCSLLCRSWEIEDLYVVQRMLILFISQFGSVKMFIFFVAQFGSVKICSSSLLCNLDLERCSIFFCCSLFIWILKERWSVMYALQMGLWLWTKQLKAMECNFGSSMMLTFAFLRWVFFLNGLLSVLWIVAIIVPFFVNPPQSYDWQEFADAFQQKNFTLAMQVWNFCHPWIPFQRTIFP